jgi:hypothetical protein
MSTPEVELKVSKSYISDIIVFFFLFYPHIFEVKKSNEAIATCKFYHLDFHFWFLMWKRVK